MPRKDLIKDVKNIVIKVGSSTITDKGKISDKKIEKFVKELITLIKKGYRITIVTSGAIAAGSAQLNKDIKTLTIPEKQALASLGQTLLINEYRKYFNKGGFNVGQILLTEDDVKHRRRFLNARHTVNTLHEFGVVPIVNENDSVVIKEIKFGDNDTLSAYVASIIDADLLILLSDIDGFYWDMKDPGPVEEINIINDEVIERAGGEGSEIGTGGMITKIHAAQIIIRFGEMMVIAKGGEEGVLSSILNGEKVGTLFVGKNKPLASKKKWLTVTKGKGKIEVDDGAVKALIEGKKSLLAIGITGIIEDFDMGDIIEILNKENKVIGKGVVNYNYEEIRSIMGKKSNEIKEILGSTYFNEVINRDDMIIFDE